MSPSSSRPFTSRAMLIPQWGIPRLNGTVPQRGSTSQKTSPAPRIDVLSSERMEIGRPEDARASAMTLSALMSASVTRAPGAFIQESRGRSADRNLSRSSLEAASEAAMAASRALVRSCVAKISL